MNYSIISESKKGILHTKKQENNQDAVYSINDNRIFSAVLADGAGSHRFAEKGAVTSARTAGRYLTSNLTKLFNSNQNNIKNELMAAVRSELNIEASRNNCSTIREFGSTLIFAASDGNKFIIGHLGDGAVLGVYNNIISVISFPENGLNNNSTHLTTELNAEKNLRIISGDLSYYQEFILMSDGLIPQVFEKGYILKNKGELSDLLSDAVHTDHDDDASFISIKWGE